MNIQWLRGWGWNTTAELGESFDEHDRIMAERALAIKYWIRYYG